MARVLITGSTGLIGRWVFEHWPGSLEYVEVRHDESDLTDPATFVEVIRGVGPSVVLHLAWSASGTRGYRTDPVNSRWVEASWQAATYCLDAGIRFVGTGTVVDDGTSEDLYARAKQELRALLSGQIDDGSIAWIRPFYTFDPAAGRPALVAEVRAAIAAGRPVELRSPAARHDFIHASDVGAAVVAVVTTGLGGSIDAGSGRLRSVAELARAIGAEVDALPESADPEPAGSADEVVADPSRLLETGWRPFATEQFFTAGPSGNPPSHF